jgi:hypothetical protein
MNFCMGEKKTFSNRIDEDRIKDLNLLHVETGKSMGALLEEAMKLLVKNYEKPTKT